MKQDPFHLSRYDYQLPEAMIAQTPAVPRDSSRLLVVERASQNLQDKKFRDIGDFLEPGDVLVLNDTRVINARLYARRPSGAKLEVFLLKERARGVWEALVNPAQRARVGETIQFQEGFTAKLVERTVDGGRVLEFSSTKINEALSRLGEVPLPRYIKQMVKDGASYQTVYAQKDGAVAAPTAGLHFTPRLLQEIQAKGVKVVYLTLHCGLATFRPVKADDVRKHPMTAEWFEITADTAKTINQAKAQGRRIVAVGTTSLRSLESAAKDGRLHAFSGETNIYIFEGYEFKIVNVLLTNFHTPCSTNLILVSAFGGYDLLHRAYQHAIAEKYRFFSFGDAMLII